MQPQLNSSSYFTKLREQQRMKPQAQGGAAPLHRLPRDFGRDKVKLRSSKLR